MQCPAASEDAQSWSRPDAARAVKSKRALSIRGLLGVMADERQPLGIVRLPAEFTALCIGTSARAVGSRAGLGSRLEQWREAGDCCLQLSPTLLERSSGSCRLRTDRKAHRNLTDQRETVGDSGEDRAMPPNLGMPPELGKRPNPLARRPTLEVVPVCS